MHAIFDALCTEVNTIATGGGERSALGNVDGRVEDEASLQVRREKEVAFVRMNRSTIGEKKANMVKLMLCGSKRRFTSFKSKIRGPSTLLRRNCVETTASG